MRALFVATSSKPRKNDQEIKLGQRPRLDYHELVKRFTDTSYVDYDTVDMVRGKIRKLEEKTKLDFFWARQVASRAKREQYESVFSLSERVGVPMSYVLNRNIRHIMDTHHPLSPKKLQLMKALRLASHWTKVTAHSQAEADVLRDTLKLRPDQIEVLLCSVDTDFYDINKADPSTIKAEGDFFLSLGISQRDYPTLIKAMKKLPQVKGHISATSAWVSSGDIYGPDPIPDNVLITSYDHPTIIRDCYARSSFVVIPIREGTSQWSVGCASLLQPQVMGKPVIATRTPGLKDYVLDGETGILVDGNKPEAMAEAIEYLWNNPTKAAEMGRRAQEWVTNTHSLDLWIEHVGRLIGYNTTKPTPELALAGK